MLQELIKGNNKLRSTYTKALENDGKIISTERLDILRTLEPFLLDVASIVYREIIYGCDADPYRELLVLGGEKTRSELFCMLKERKWNLRGTFSREELEIPSRVERIFEFIRKAAHVRQVPQGDRVVIRPALVDLLHRLVSLHHLLEVPRTTF